jgi:hypothetical protein
MDEATLNKFKEVNISDYDAVNEDLYYQNKAKIIKGSEFNEYFDLPKLQTIKPK